MLQISLIFLIIFGLLDATAILNISNFGIGAYVACDAFALVSLWVHSRDATSFKIDLDRDTFLLCFAMIAMIWTVAAVQTWQENADIWRIITQTTLRTLLVAHFLICSATMNALADRKLLLRVLTLFVAFYLVYGIYDFVAQVLDYPRFLDWLRNSHSLNINRGVGLQGWIVLPRLSSLAAEPSHTAMHVLLALFIATAAPRRLVRYSLIFLALAFCVGTFARTVWIAIAGATLGAGGIAMLIRLNLHQRKSATLVAAVTTILPIAVLLIPLFTHLPIDADESVVERLDSSKAGIWLFSQHPLLGMGLHGWDNHPSYAIVDKISSLPGDLRDVLNGVAVYLAALGIWGLYVVYVPLVIILKSRIGLPAKAWWSCAFSLILLGGDYLALASTWTALAIITTSWSSNQSRPGTTVRDAQTQ